MQIPFSYWALRHAQSTGGMASRIDYDDARAFFYDYANRCIVSYSRDSKEYKEFSANHVEIPYSIILEIRYFVFFMLGEADTYGNAKLSQFLWDCGDNLREAYGWDSEHHYTSREIHLYVKDTEGNWYKSFMPRNDEQTQELCKEYRTGNIDEEKSYKVKLNRTWYDVSQE